MTGTVTIACKLPAGLHLDLMSEADSDGRRVLVESVRIRGNAAARRLERADDNGTPIDMGPLADVQGGYGLTHGVDADFWAAWLKQNAEYAPVKRGMIFAAGKADSAASKAREQAEIKTGFEALDPAKPAPRIQRLERGEIRQAA